MKRILLTTAALALLTTAAHADNITQLYSSGDWSAFHVASNDNGKPMCGAKVSLTLPGDDKVSMTMKYSNESGLFLHVSKDSWSFASGLVVPLDISIGDGHRLGGGLTEVSPTGKSMIGIYFTVSFLTNFADTKAKTITVGFDEGLKQFAKKHGIQILDKPTTGQPWVFSMAGSFGAVKEFGQCIVNISPPSPVVHTKDVSSNMLSEELNQTEWSKEYDQKIARYRR